MLSEENQVVVGNIPAYRCTLDNDDTMSFDCPFCLRAHTHGVDTDEDAPYEPTHRSAHCQDRGIYHPNGYYVFYT